MDTEFILFFYFIIFLFEAPFFMMSTQINEFNIVIAKRKNICNESHT